MLPRRAAFVLAAASLMAVYLASGAPSPLFVVYQHEWGFPDLFITIAFGSYAVTLLASLLVFGSLSDHLGRRPVIALALALGIVALVIFILADGIGWIIVGRSLQGITTGMVTTAYTALLVELGPDGSRAGPVVAAVTPPLGLGLGALLAGGVIQISEAHANTALFLGFIVVALASIVLVALTPETGGRRPGAVRALLPRIVVPPAARGFFLRILPVVLAAWMCGAIFLGLSAPIVEELLDVHSGLLNGVTAFIHGAGVALGGTLFGRLPVRRALITGCVGVAVGMTIVAAGVATAVLPLVWLGGATEAIAFGAAFGACFRGMAPLVSDANRAGAFAAIYVLAYVALGVPGMLVGLLIAPLGLLPAILLWTAVIIATAVVGIVVQVRRPVDTLAA